MAGQEQRAPRTRQDAPASGYASLSTQPLYVLVFLLPLVLFYEAGSAIWLRDASTGARQEIFAHRLMNDFFQLFGAGGIFLPGVAMIVVLLVWHVLLRDPWKVRWPVLVVMLVESILWTLPLLVLAQMVSAAARAAAEAGVDQIAALPWEGRAAVAIGAGLYEEMLFRMVAIAGLHFVLVDLLGVKETPGRVTAITLAALAFALYHQDASGFAFYLLAGLYFGGVYVWRGFGIVVAVHAIYDLVALLLAPGG